MPGSRQPIEPPYNPATQYRIAKKADTEGNPPVNTPTDLAHYDGPDGHSPGVHIFRKDPPGVGYVRVASSDAVVSNNSPLKKYKVIANGDQRRRKSRRSTRKTRRRRNNRK
jgi:hypothetical protein